MQRVRSILGDKRMQLENPKTPKKPMQILGGEEGELPGAEPRT